VLWKGESALVRKIPSNVLIIDVEATCWEGTVPQGQESEIIEIGLCMVHTASGKRGEKRSILVKPERSRVSTFCTQLTSLTQQQVEQGISFADACSLLQRDYASKECIWISYGEYDRRQFERQCQSYHVPYPFSSNHINLKLFFALLQGLPAQVGMAEALRILHLPLEGTHHRGGDDAWNIAGILSELMRRNRVLTL